VEQPVGKRLRCAQVCLRALAIVGAHEHLVDATAKIVGSQGTCGWVHGALSRLMGALLRCTIQYRDTFRNSQSFFRMHGIGNANHIYPIVGYRQY